MTAWPVWIIVVVLFGVAFHAAAQTPSEIRRDARLTAQDLTELRTLEELPPGVDWKATAGAARTAAENGERRRSTPFQLRALFDQGRTAFKLSGDGFASVHAPDGNSAGLNDVNAVLSRAMAPGLIAEIGLTLPSGGEVGSADGRERVGVVYNSTLSGRWDGLVHLRLVRFDARPPPGVSRTRRQGLVQATYNFDAPRTALTFQLERSYRPGAGGATQAAAIFEFPLLATKRPPVAALGFTRGLTAGSRDTTLECDVSFRF